MYNLLDENDVIMYCVLLTDLTTISCQRKIKLIVNLVVVSNIAV